VTDLISGEPTFVDPASVPVLAARRGIQVAVVAAARKLTVLCWHLIIKGEDYACGAAVGR
jgi:hypothetical protein